MKTRFNTYDIICNVTDLQRLVGLRVNQVYDIDNKTYLIRFQERDTKTVLLLESGNRFHTTAFEWPKSMTPNGFTMKMRKHLKNKRLEKFVQLGTDRIIDLQFGADEAAYHIIVELYDRGNIILTDYELTILNILRPRVEGEELRFTVRQKYPENRAKENDGQLSEEFLRNVLQNAKGGDNLKKVLNPILPFGPAVIDHILIKNNLFGTKIATTNVVGEDDAGGKEPDGKKGKQKNKHQQNADASKRELNLDADLPVIMSAIQEGYQMQAEASFSKSKGYIIQKRETKPSANGDEPDFFMHNLEYHPYLFAQTGDQPYKEFDSFDAAVDEFYSTLEGQKIDVKAMHQERDALKKLQNVKKDHEKRLTDLSRTQILDKQRAELITRNQALVENAIYAIRSAIASQLSWPDIHDLVKTAQKKGDATALTIKHLKLETNHISLSLSDPYKAMANDSDDNTKSDGNDEDDPMENLKPMIVDIDLGMSAYSNATRYYDQKRSAAKKEQRTIESSGKALKSAERKTQQTLKEVRLISTISKARKVYWFEKFYWFISSENYVVIGGRDQQQNELIVKRYMRPSDIYVHAEIQGASSVVIRNPSGADVPPKTLHEAGVMAISYSVAWDAKVVTNAYWVKSDQVSKTAPTGEYLGTGSFMIRGKKNFLPPCNLVLGLSLLFRLEDGSVARHAGERRVRNFDDDFDAESIAATESVKLEDDEIELIGSDAEDGDGTPSKLDAVLEEMEQSPDDGEPAETVENEQEEEEEQDDDDDDDDGSQFPDTHVKIHHDTGKVILQPDLKLESIRSPSDAAAKGTDDDAFIIFGAPQRKVKQSKQKIERQQRKSGKTAISAVDAEEKENDVVDDRTDQQKSSQLKRRQKNKLKKIKEKYGDQDEEEKQIRMAILKSAGTGKMAKKSTKPNEVTVKPKKATPVAKADLANKAPAPADDDGADDNVAVDVDMLDALTGCPVTEDEILFAVPVIAPYQALQNYKFKVKLMPGTGRRGRVSKTALLIFSKDKACTQREKDLLKSVKDETIARNIPGNVKLSAPQLQKYKK